MDNFFLGSEIRFGNSTYRVINRIGCWGPDFQYPVYESECFVNNIRVPNRALKTLSRTVAGGQPIWEEEGIWENVNKDITEMLDCFIDPGIDTTLLLFDERFYINSNNVQYICIAFALQENMSLRTAMLLDQRFSQGFTVPQIRRAASNMVSAIRDLHHFSLNHTELSAGHLVCSPQHIKVAATCSAFEVDWHAGFAANHFLPINRISDWGRAPDIVDNEEAQLPHELEEALAAQPPRGLLEAAAAEGDIEAQLNFWNQNQFLHVANYIDEIGILPETWEQLLENSEAQMPIHGLAGRFTNEFINFLRTCLRMNQYARPDTLGLLNDDFLGPVGMMSEEDFRLSLLQQNH
ncbi:hypothetical protein ACET3Z_029081 [Daucus carota]